MVHKTDVLGALTDGWQSTPQVAGRVERRARTARQHEFQVYQALGALADAGMAERYRAGNLVYWRKVRCRPAGRCSPHSPTGRPSGTRRKPSDARGDPSDRTARLWPPRDTSRPDS